MRGEASLDLELCKLCCCCVDVCLVRECLRLLEDVVVVVVVETDSDTVTRSPL